MVEEARRRSTCCGVRNLLLGLLGGLLLGGLLGRLLLVAALLGSLLRASLGGLLGSSLGHVDEVLGLGEFFPFGLKREAFSAGFRFLRLSTCDGRSARARRDSVQFGLFGVCLCSKRLRARGRERSSTR